MKVAFVVVQLIAVSTMIFLLWDSRGTTIRELIKSERMLAGHEVVQQLFRYDKETGLLMPKTTDGFNGEHIVTAIMAAQTPYTTIGLPRKERRRIKAEQKREEERRRREEELSA